MEEQLDLISLIKLILKYWKVIIAGILTGIILAAAISLYMKPEYQASTEILLSQAQKTQTQTQAQAQTQESQQINETYQVLQLSEQLAKTFTQMISSRALAEQVIKNNKLAMKPEKLQDRVRAVQIEETQLIRITVTDTGAKRSALLANEYSKAFAIMVKNSIPASAVISITVIDPATVPEGPVKPRPAINLMLGFLFGVLIAIGTVFVLEKLDTTVQEPEQVEELLNIVSLAKVPDSDQPLLIDNDNMQNSEAFRGLRTNLQYLNFNQSIKTIAVTSADMGDGKTTVTINMATVYAKAGNNVLIIDCDLRRPMVGKTLNCTGRGLSELLVGKSNLKSVINKTRIDGLHVINSGLIPPNPADLLESDRLTNLLNELKEEFDIIFLDCPPVLGVSDAVILASKSDAILLVTHAGKTKKQDIVLAKDVLKKIDARILGFVINGVHMDNKNNYYYYSSSYNRRRAVGDGTRS